MEYENYIFQVCILAVFPTFIGIIVSSAEEKIILKMMKMGVTKLGAIRLLGTMNEEQLNGMTKSDTALKSFIDEKYFHK